MLVSKGVILAQLMGAKTYHPAFLIAGINNLGCWQDTSHCGCRIGAIFGGTIDMIEALNEIDGPPPFRTYLFAPNLYYQLV